MRAVVLFVDVQIARLISALLSNQSPHILIGTAQLPTFLYMKLVQLIDTIHIEESDCVRYLASNFNFADFNVSKGSGKTLQFLSAD